MRTNIKSRTGWPAVAPSAEDTERYIEACTILSPHAKAEIQGNARRLFPCLEAALQAQGR
jgi:hypothetical protein